MIIKIITIYSKLTNYGNRLQNYAVTHVLENLTNASVRTILFENMNMKFKEKAKGIINKITFYKFTKNKEYWKTIFKKIKTFNNFTNKYIISKKIKYISQLKNADNYTISSDQVWNPTWYEHNPLYRHIYLLYYAKFEQKVCFSLSFGIEEQTQEWKSWFKEKLNTFPKISVREDAGKK